jgi:hypothetical protein
MITYNIIVSGVQIFEETGGSPATAENDEGLFLWVKGHLRPRILFTLSEKVQGASTTNCRDKSCLSDELKETLPS